MNKTYEWHKNIHYPYGENVQPFRCDEEYKVLSAYALYQAVLIPSQKK